MTALATKLAETAARRAPQRFLDACYKHRNEVPFRWVRSMLARWIGDARSGRKAVRGPLRGFRFAFVSEDSKALWMGLHEQEVVRAVEDVVKPGMTAIDIGAHVGYYVLIFARLVGPSGRVVGYEPDPANHALLVRNIEANALEGFCDARRKALSSSKGKGSLQRSPMHSGMTWIQFEDDPEIAAALNGSGVPITTLDDEVFGDVIEPDVIMIDTEGAEEEILLNGGASRMLTERSPVIFVEHHDRRDHLIERFAEYGYDYVDIDSGHTMFRKRA